MPPPGCRVFAGFLADHGPHNIANVPALLPSYIALAAVLTDRNNELNFQREEMLQERACKLPSPLSWPNQEFCYQIHQSTDTIPFCMDYFNWFFMYQFHAYLVFFTYVHNKLIRKKPVKIAGTTKRNCLLIDESDSKIFDLVRRAVWRHQKLFQKLANFYIKPWMEKDVNL